MTNPKKREEVKILIELFIPLKNGVLVTVNKLVFARKNKETVPIKICTLRP